jgi:hypothetical protein
MAKKTINAKTVKDWVFHAFLTGLVRIISPPWHRPLGWHPSACGRRNSECSTIITNNILLYFMQVKLISDQLRNIKDMNEYNKYAIVY